MQSRAPYLEIARRLRPILSRPPRLTVSQWADKYRYLSSESAAKPGKYHSSFAPYQREIMDAANDPTVQTIDGMMASQVGKTTIGENVVGYFIDADPSPILWVEPTDTLAKDYSKERLAPMIRDTPRLKGKVKDARSRDSGNTISMKLFPGGSVAMAGANTPSGLAGRPRRVVLLDEIDRYPISAGPEGDPCALAEKRTEAYWNAVIYRLSTPTVKNVSRIETNFNLTDKRYWFVPCPHCGTFQTLKWQQVLWGSERIKHWNAHQPIKVETPSDFADGGEDAVYSCEHCHAHLNDAERIRMIHSGQWRATAPFKGKRGYHLNGIYSPFKAKKGYRSRLHQMVDEFLKATAGGIEKLKVWTNTFLAETWEERVERIETAPLMKRAEDYTPKTLPNEIILALASVDVQKTYLQVEVMGLGLDEQTWGIEFKSIEGDPEQDDVWHGPGGLAELLAASYTREDGIVIPITATAIDMGHLPKRVQAFAKKCGLPRIYPVYGSPGGNQTLLVTSKFSRHYNLRTYSVDTKQAKDTIFARLQVEEPGPRFMHYPAGHGYNEEYFEQLTAEVLKTKFEHGFAKQFYEKVRPRNEALDLRVYLLAAIDILKPNLTAIAKRLRRPDEPPDNPPRDYPIKPPPGTPPSQPAQRPPGRVRIRVGNWGQKPF